MDKETLFKEVTKYDNKDNLIYYENSFDYKCWYKYDKNNNIIHTKNSNNNEFWYKYNKNNELTYTKKLIDGEIKEFNEHHKIFYSKKSYGDEYFYEYKEKRTLIHHKPKNNSFGNEKWYILDENNKEIYSKNSKGYECWFEYDKNNKQIKITEKEFNKIENRKAIFNNKRINRFEIMDI